VNRAEGRGDKSEGDDEAGSGVVKVGGRVVDGWVDKEKSEGEELRRERRSRGKGGEWCRPDHRLSRRLWCVQLERECDWTLIKCLLLNPAGERHTGVRLAVRIYLTVAAKQFTVDCSLVGIRQ